MSAQANSSQDLISKKILHTHTKKAGGVDQGIGSEFKPQYHSWQHGSSGRALAWKKKVSNPNTTKKKKQNKETLRKVLPRSGLTGALAICGAFLFVIFFF
jgi:hypothetical protein